MSAENVYGFTKGEDVWCKLILILVSLLQSKLTSSGSNLLRLEDLLFVEDLLCMRKIVRCCPLGFNQIVW